MDWIADKQAPSKAKSTKYSSYANTSCIDCVHGVFKKCKILIIFDFILIRAYLIFTTIFKLYQLQFTTVHIIVFNLFVNFVSIVYDLYMLQISSIHYLKINWGKVKQQKKFGLSGMERPLTLSSAARYDYTVNRYSHTWNIVTHCSRNATHCATVAGMKVQMSAEPLVRSLFKSEKLYHATAATTQRHADR